MQVLDELKRMSDERFLSLYEALAQNGFGPLDGEVAKMVANGSVSKVDDPPYCISPLTVATRPSSGVGKSAVSAIQSQTSSVA